VIFLFWTSLFFFNFLKFIKITQLTYLIFFKNLFLNKKYKNKRSRLFTKKLSKGALTAAYSLKLDFLFLLYSKTPLRTLKPFFSFKEKLKLCLFYYKKTIGDGFMFVRGLFLIFLVDALVTDDEPLWEPIEWSLVQTWLLFIFIFAWIAENLITSRFGSYTGRDKRVWLAWYKSFWMIELIYVISYGATSMFVIVPFYYELTYNLTFVFSWWNWYTKIFFFKFISLYTFVLLLANYLLINVKWFNWKKNLILIFLILFFLLFLLYTQFIITFFSYFTDPLWYQKTRFVDYIQLSHEPLKWGWGPSERDHFTYHKVSTVFWFKNDAPFAGAFLMFNFFFFFCLFGLTLYWVTLFRRVYTTNEISYTFVVYCVSSLKQFFFFFLLLFGLIFISFIMSYWRFPIEFFWLKNSNNWIFHFYTVFWDYFFFLINF
jgi:hypothetical protein